MTATSVQRGFRLLVDPVGDEYGVRLEQTNGSSATPPIPVAKADPVTVSRLREPLLTAVRSSGHTRTVLSPTRQRPLTLAESAGVRLALILLAVGRNTRWERIEQITHRVSAMGVEETYYWYAKCMRPAAKRGRRSLSTLTAG